MNATRRVFRRPSLNLNVDSFTSAGITVEVPIETPRPSTTDTKSSTLHPQYRRFNVTIDAENDKLDKELASLLHLHSIGLPLLISFDSLDTNYYKRYTPGIFGVFHCPRCLASWHRTNKLRSRCGENARFVQGPKFPLSASDATKVLTLLQWSKKFASVNVINALPSLRQAFCDEEETRILNALHQVKVSKDPTHFQSSQMKALKMKRNKEMTTKVAYYLRRYLFSNAAKSTLNQYHHDCNTLTEDDTNRVSLVGMQSVDGCFYPGFFSHEQLQSKQTDVYFASESREDQLKRIKRNLLSDLPFLASGCFDEDCHFHSYKDDAARLSDLDQLPSLHDVVASQAKLSSDTDPYDQQHKIRNFVESELNDKDLVKFCFQGGEELKLSEVFASGIWYADGNDEYFFAGVFNGQGIFKASYCITNHGFLIPGTANDRRRFYPICKYAADGSIAVTFSSKDLCHKLHYVFGQMFNILRFPHASELQPDENTTWICVRNGTVTTDPACITVLSDGLFADSESLNVYVGGEMTSDGQLYLFGKQNHKGQFIPGAPAVLTDTAIQEITDYTGPEMSLKVEFSRRFGVQVDEIRPLLHSTTTFSLPNFKHEDSDRLHCTRSNNNERKKALFGDFSQNIKLQILRNKKLKETKRRNSLPFTIKLPGAEERPAETEEAHQHLDSSYGRFISSAVSRERANFAVRNRSGKPSTKQGILIQAYFSTPYGDSAVSKMELSATDRVRRNSDKTCSDTYQLQKEFIDARRNSQMKDYAAYTNRHLRMRKNYTDIVKRGVIRAEVFGKMTTGQDFPETKSDSVEKSFPERRANEPTKATKAKKSWSLRKSPNENKVLQKEKKSPSPEPTKPQRVSILPKKSGSTDSLKKKKKKKRRNSDSTSTLSRGRGGGGDVPCPPFTLETDEDRRSSLKSPFPLTLSTLSSLSFTQSYSFSYFNVPKYITDYNKKIMNGKIEIPNLS